MRKVLAVVLGFLVLGVGMVFANTAVKDGASITTEPSSIYFREDYSDDGSIVPVSDSYPLPVATVERAGSWLTARINVIANDTATTYGTNDTGNFSVAGYSHVRYRIFMNATADSATFACGSATPTTNPYYGYTPTVTISGYSTTAPFTCDCDTNGQTIMFPRITGLSSGGNVTTIKAQAYN